MVWALILSIALFTSDVVDIVEVITPEDGEVIEETDTPDAEEPEPVPVVVEVPEQDITLFSDTGELVYTSESPSEVNRAVSGLPYSSVTDNSYSQIAARTILKSGWDDDYVFWRSGQYEYTLAMGDIELSGSTFTGADVDLVRYTLDSGYNGTYRITTDVDSLNLNAQDYIVFSNLGKYPLFDNEYVFGRIAVFSLAIIAACYAMSRILSFSLRTGQYVWNINTGR